MSKIIATAENYAFGPAGKLVTVCKHLINQGHQVIFVGTGTAYQLASKLNFNKIYEYDTDSPSFMDWGVDIFKGADALLSSIDRESVILAQKVNLPVIWLDMLFWWWDVIPEFLFDVDLYIQQNSVKNKRNMKKYGDKIKNMKVVGPIIDTSFKNVPGKKQLLVAFGGIEAAGWYKIGKDSNYPYTITKIIINDVDTSKYDKVLFAGNEKIMKDLNQKYGSKKYIFKILSHDDWLREVAASKDLLIHPGLETVLEVIAYEKPAFFLPPDNSSGYVELDEFRRKKVASKTNSIHFADYFPHKDYLGRNLRKIMEEFMAEMREFEASNEILDNCAKRINRFINLSQARKNKQILKQKMYMNEYGNNGLDETIHIIGNFLSSIRDR